ncbi:MAG: cation diffusion facilitator family transporter [Clostridia bacterium]|nr:cation diffusion facilitator family transporter [Clostridia bacterium]
MIKFLLKKFIPDYKNTQNSTVREGYGVLGGILGIILNMFLFATKLVIGFLSGSIAIISDSFNNLSDSGSSVVALLGAKLANRRPDSEHPFGHGRYEYVASLIVGFITFLLGFELLKSSGAKILNPEPTILKPIMLIILGLSALVKLWMYSYNTYLGNKISSSVLIATAKDSVSDFIATVAIIIASFLSSLFNLPVLDGVIGVIVSALIMKTGFSVAMDTIGILLGKSPEKEVVEMLKNTILEGEGIMGVHDLVVHDYGPGRAFASVHAEVPYNYDMVKVHEIIDELEHRISHETGIHIVIHMDPVKTDCEVTNSIKAKVIEVIKAYDERLNIHDFRITDGENRINLIFDLEVPIDLSNSGKIVVSDIVKQIENLDERYKTVIDVDLVYS